jgi:quercetin dioxygenase-like cupin family protein
MRNFASSFVVAVMLALAPAMARAQAYPAQQLLSTGKTVLGEDITYPTSGPARVTVTIVTIAPGADGALHRHPAPLVAYILDGELTVDYGINGRRVYRQGEALVEAMNVAHHGMNFGSVPVRLLAVYVGAEGTADVALEK